MRRITAGAMLWTIAIPVLAADFVTPMLETQRKQAEIELMRAQTACLNAGGTRCVLPPGSTTAPLVDAKARDVTCTRDKGWLECSDGRRTTTCIGDSQFVACTTRSEAAATRLIYLPN